jgi:2-oxo-4-hydroxy-4-carboxy--5-ureidoimidazoline (OHCU) decarboxylase
MSARRRLSDQPESRVSRALTQIAPIAQLRPVPG